jgi:hypothetical protein
VNLLKIQTETYPDLLRIGGRPAGHQNLPLGTTTNARGVKVETMGSPQFAIMTPRSGGLTGCGLGRSIRCDGCRSTAYTVSPSQTLAISVAMITISVVLASMLMMGVTASASVISSMTSSMRAICCCKPLRSLQDGWWPNP